MINELNLESIYKEFVNRLSIENTKGLEDDPVEMLKRSPENFMKSLKNKTLKLEKFDRDTHIKIFYIVCNKLKEIERETKLRGLEIMSNLIDFIPEPYFMNAYVFEKELIAKAPSQSTHKKKFVSVGDYELAKFDSSMGINYGFFASVLEEEMKEIKINTLKIISVIGAKEINREFAIKSFKYIIELVNDEEDEVRYETVKTLEFLIGNFKSIEVESLEIIFFNMKEKSPKLRSLIYSLFSKIHCHEEKDFKVIIENIINNLKLFKEDKLLIYQAIKQFSKNNCSLLNSQYINAILDIDPNFLITEYNWNDMIYNSTMIVLQEFLKFNNFKVKLTLPKFFIKHFNYLSDKYQSIFEKEFYRNLVAIYNNSEIDSVSRMEMEEKRERKITNNIHSNNNNFEFECELEKIKTFIRSLNKKHDKNFNESYKYIISFLKILLTIKEIKISSIITIIDGIISILEMINFKIILELTNTCRQLVNFNEILCRYFIFELRSFTDIVLNKENQQEEEITFILNSQEFKSLKNSKAFSLFVEYLETFISQVSNDKTAIEPVNVRNLKAHLICISIMNSLNSNFYEVLGETFPIILITNPKKNFNYVHTKEKINYPFYIKLAIKIKFSSLLENFKISDNIPFLIKNFNIFLVKLNVFKKIDFTASNVKFSESEKTLSIKTKVPVYLSRYEDGEHKISLSLRSQKKEMFKEIINKLQINTISSEDIKINKELNFIITF